METESTELPGYIRRSGFIHGMFILIVLVAAAMAWGWLMQVTVKQIDVRHVVNANETEVLDLAGVDTGQVLFDLHPSIIADRVARHPWVRKASVTRMPIGKLIISVQERRPIVRILDSRGRADFYLDRDGFQLPEPDSVTYDLPLLSGYPESFHPVTPTEDAEILELLAALDSGQNAASLLISEIVYRQEEFWLQLEPSGEHSSTPVRIGTGNLHRKLRRLEAFWQQRMITRQDRLFELIDLRFSSQIITREQDRD